MNSITHSNVLRFCGIMDNAYSYDAVSNGLSVVNKAAFPVKGISTILDGSIYGSRQTISKTAGSANNTKIMRLPL